MGCEKRLDKYFENALILPFSPDSRICIFSDCHRGSGTHNDNFQKNEHLYIHALQYYDKHNFTYIELGDGDELWENRDFRQIAEIHEQTFRQLNKFHLKKKLYMVYGNHDMIKRDSTFSQNKCTQIFCTSSQKHEKIFTKITYYPAIILQDTISKKELYLTHGHQTSLLNSTFWRAGRFLVRYIWTPLEQVGFLDPTSAARNYKAKEAAERNLLNWATKNNHILITGHTHRPIIGNKSSPYYNCGSCVHPHGITCLELYKGRITLVKWYMNVKENGTLFVERKELGSSVY